MHGAVIVEVSMNSLIKRYKSIRQQNTHPTSDLERCMLNSKRNHQQAYYSFCMCDVKPA